MNKPTDKNRLSIVCPELCNEWNWEKNGELKPEETCYGSNKKVWWKCEHGHEWIANIASRSIGKLKCPVCAGQVVSDKNRLSMVYPDVCKWWDYDKNYPLRPENVSHGLNKNVYWICSNGHCRKAQIISVVKAYRKNGGSGCHYCYGRSVKGKPGPCVGTTFNRKFDKADSLLSKYPKLCKEWDYGKNKSLKPSDVSFASHKMVGWKCPRGHRYLAEIKARTRGNGCPYCLNRKIDRNNCLATMLPELAKEWHPTKNGKLTPYEVPVSSKRKIHWLCKLKGHEWIASLGHRGRGEGCPFCNKIALNDGTFFDSLPEAYLYLKLKARKFDMKLNKSYGFKGYRYDFYLPRFDTYIEVTSFYAGAMGYAKKIWPNYYKKIMRKKKYVEEVLGAKFRFIQIKMNKNQVPLCQEKFFAIILDSLLLSDMIISLKIRNGE